MNSDTTLGLDYHLDPAHLILSLITMDPEGDRVVSQVSIPLSDLKEALSNLPE